MKLILLLTLLGTVLSVPYGPKPEVKKAPIELVIEDICLDKPSELPQELFADIKVAGSRRSYAPKSYSPKGYAPSPYSPKRFAPKSYSPKRYAPTSYSPKSYTPKSYSPKGYVPRSHAPKSFAPKSFTPKRSYTPTKPVAVKGKGQYMPSKFGAVKGNDKKAIDLVISDIVLDQPKEIVIKKDSFNPQRIVPKGFAPPRSYSPKSYSPYTPKSYTPKSYSPKSYTPKSYSPKSSYTPDYKGYGGYNNGYNGGKFF